MRGHARRTELACPPSGGKARVATGSLAVTMALSLVACGETGQARIEIPLAVVGTRAEPITVGDWDVTVREARVAFGPVYLCASQNAGLDACAQAAAEHLGATGFDALSDTPTPMGTLTAISGLTVLSGMWDYARSWRLSETAPHPLPGAIDGAHSAVLTIAATRRADGLERSYRFVLDVDGAGQPSGSTATRARLDAHTLSARDTGLLVRFDPNLWASMLDYDLLGGLEDASPGDGLVDVSEEDPSRSALISALTVTGLPSFEWQAESN